MKSSKYKPLNNIQICTTGLDDDETEIIKDKIEAQGGIFTENLSKKTNYLISDRINTKKSLAARDQKIKIITKEWILNENDERYLNVKKATIKCFHKLSIFLFGYEEISSEYLTLVKQIQDNDGIIVNNSIEADALVFKKGLFFGEKEMIEMEKFKERIVTIDWIEECIQSKRYLDLIEARFQIKNEILQNKYDLIEESIISSEEGRSKLFIDFVFYIADDYDNESKAIILKVISLGSGLIYKKITPVTTHIICSTNYDDHKGEIENYSNHSCPQKITVNWLLESLETDSLKSYEDYHPIESFSMSSMENNKGSRGRRYRQMTVSNIFIHETFSIYKSTYTPDEYQSIKEKIIENNGKMLDIKEDEDFLKNLTAKYLIINDGFDILLAELLRIVSALTSHHAVVSHRFVDVCIEKRKIVDFNDHLNLYPFSFKVPHREMIEKNIQIYIPNSYYSFSEKNTYEVLIDTLGAKVDLTSKTTHVIVNREMKKSDLNKIKKKSNPNIKAVNDEWLVDFILNGYLQPEDNYQPQMID